MSEAEGTKGLSLFSMKCMMEYNGSKCTFKIKNIKQIKILEAKFKPPVISETNGVNIIPYEHFKLISIGAPTYKDFSNPKVQEQIEFGLRINNQMIAYCDSTCVGIIIGDKSDFADNTIMSVAKFLEKSKRVVTKEGVVILKAK